jgi:hypothetical protein
VDIDVDRGGNQLVKYGRGIAEMAGDVVGESAGINRLETENERVLPRKLSQ